MQKKVAPLRKQQKQSRKTIGGPVGPVGATGPTISSNRINRDYKSNTRLHAFVSSLSFLKYHKLI